MSRTELPHNNQESRGGSQMSAVSRLACRAREQHYCIRRELAE